MREGKLPLGLLIAALIAGVATSAFWAGQASSSGSPEEIRTYQPGWANVAWLQDTMPAEAALSSIADSLGVVYYLDPDSGSWQRYIPGRPEVSNMTTMAFGKAYLMLFTKPATGNAVTEPEDICPPCPTDTSCPCTYGSLPDLCASVKAGIELDEILLEMVEAGLPMTTTKSELQAMIAAQQQRFIEDCLGVVFPEPSALTATCGTVGKWIGQVEGLIQISPSAQAMTWLTQLNDMLDGYCQPY